MTFDELLNKNGLQRTGVSHGIQQKMKRYDRYIKALAEAKVKLEKTKSPPARENIEKIITEGEENVSSLNNEICAGVENYIKNKDLNDRKAKILKDARETRANKANPPAATTTVTYTVDGVAEKIFKREKIDVKEEIDFYDANKDAIDAAVEKLKPEDQTIEHQEVPVKKSNTGKIVLGVLGTIALGALAFFGIREYKKNN